MAPKLRIFSYLPNPRVWKATIAARLCGVELEVRGASVEALKDWLFDFDARPLTAGDQAAFLKLRQPSQRGFGGTPLFKTEAFLFTHPFGTVPAAFSPDGVTGIFESNSIMRAVARLGCGEARLFGNGPYEASRVDSFLDASLAFAVDTQRYLVALRSASVNPVFHETVEHAITSYLMGVERALSHQGAYLVGGDLTAADICFFCELALMSNERTGSDALERAGLKPVMGIRLLSAFPRAFAHFRALRAHPAFAADTAEYSQKLGHPPFTEV